MRFAFTFPGQGSQTVGMGRDLAESFSSAKRVFEEVDDALGEKLTEIMWGGPAEVLTLTKNAQPALMAVSMAAMAALQEAGGLTPKNGPSFVAGHSLGEYSALAAAGTFSLADAARLLRLRGQAMQEAVPPGDGAMLALLGAEIEQAERLAVAAAEASGFVCQIANDNAPGQVVLSGAKVAIDKAVQLAADHGVRKTVPLPVSAPFHCALMQPAAEKMAAALAEVPMRAPRYPVVTNVTASAVEDPATIRDLLVKQVTGVVRWRESVAYVAEQGVSVVFEVGAGRVLTGLARRIKSDLDARSIGTAAEIRAFAEWINA